MKTTQLHLLILGDQKVGKTCLIDRFFNPSQKPISKDHTIIDSYRIQHITSSKDPNRIKKLDELCELKKIDLTITEVGGQHPILLHEVIHDADGFMICYSVGSKKSFALAYDLYQKIVKTKYNGEFGGLPILLLGTKIDLCTETAIKNGLEGACAREVTFEMGQELSYLLQTNFLETTCMAATSVATCFKILIQRSQEYYYGQNNVSPKPEKGKPLQMLKGMFSLKPKHNRKIADEDSSLGDINRNIRVWIPDQELMEPLPGTLRSQLNQAYELHLKELENSTFDTKSSDSEKKFKRTSTDSNYESNSPQSTLRMSSIEPIFSSISTSSTDPKRSSTSDKLFQLKLLINDLEEIQIKE